MIQGIHHVSMKATKDKYPKVISFYKDLLGLKVKVEWETGIMLDSGMGCIEIFNDGTQDEIKGIIGHYAFGVDHVDEMIEKVRKEGYTIIMEPKDVQLGHIYARVGFCRGVLGEEIEFFEER